MDSIKPEAGQFAGSNGSRKEWADDVQCHSSRTSSYNIGLAKLDPNAKENNFVVKARGCRSASVWSSNTATRVAEIAIDDAESAEAIQEDLPTPLRCRKNGNPEKKTPLSGGGGGGAATSFTPQGRFTEEEIAEVVSAWTVRPGSTRKYDGKRASQTTRDGRSLQSTRDGPRRSVSRSLDAFVAAAAGCRTESSDRMFPVPRPAPVSARPSCAKHSPRSCSMTIPAHGCGST